MNWPWKRKGPAWQAWSDGEVERAGELSRELSEDEGFHLRFLVFAVSGRYDEALATHAAISPGYRHHREMDEALLDVHRHLRRYDVSIARSTVVPFADHPLTPYFPAFAVEINGETLLAHVDTGGTFLVMNPERARRLGIDLVPRGRGYHGTRKTELSEGLARSLRIGGASLENVPVECLASLSGEQDFVLFGASVLEQFLATLDYPRGRLVLSPRSGAARDQHFQLVPGCERVEVPFFLWGDHYLWARGGVGDRRELNFFIDSGLVLIHPDGRGGHKQAAFSARARDLIRWGVPRAETRKEFFDSRLPLSLGSVTAEDLTFHVEDRPSWSSFGGVRIDGLLSHAFLSKQAWTLDFDRRRFVFSA